MSSSQFYEQHADLFQIDGSSSGDQLENFNDLVDAFSSEAVVASKSDETFRDLMAQLTVHELSVSTQDDSAWLEQNIEHKKKNSLLKVKDFTWNEPKSVDTMAPVFYDPTPASKLSSYPNRIPQYTNAREESFIEKSSTNLNNDHANREASRRVENGSEVYLKDTTQVVQPIENLNDDLNTNHDEEHSRNMISSHTLSSSEMMRKLDILLGRRQIGRSSWNAANLPSVVHDRLVAFNKLESRKIRLKTMLHSEYNRMIQLLEKRR